jgi:hypothetical protein
MLSTRRTVIAAPVTNNGQIVGAAPAPGGDASAAASETTTTTTTDTPIKPGFTTSEGILSTLTALVQAVLMCVIAFNKDLVTPEQRTAIMQVMSAGIAATVAFYSYSRSQVKSAALKS